MVAEKLGDTDDFKAPGAETKTEKERLPSTSVEVEVGGLSHRGYVRPNNEDCYLISRFGRSLHTVLTNLPEEFAPETHREMGYGLLVADGLGGPAAGEVASRTAVQLLNQLVVDTPDWMLSLEKPLLDIVMERMVQRFSEIDRMIVAQAQQNSECKGMGTTLTLACNLGLEMVICHIGDSRAYRLRGGQMEQLTRDMTIAQDLVDAGSLDASAKSTSNLRHVLTQSIGTGNAHADVQRQTLQNGDRILLCTDGLTEMVRDPEIAEVLRAVATPADACHELVQRALGNGGRDNVTVVLADYRVK